MPFPFKRKTTPYDEILRQLMLALVDLDPTTPEYQAVMARIDELNKIQNRTSELKKTVIPTLGTIGGVVGIYGLQQFAGILIPKALDSIAARQEQKKNPKELD